MASSYTAKSGTIDRDSINIEPPSPGGDILQSQTEDVTYEPNQLLDFHFVAKHDVPRAGFIKVRFPKNTFTFNAAATAVAQYWVRPDGTGANVATIRKVVNTDEVDDWCKDAAGESGSGCIIGMVNTEDGLKKG